MMVAPQKCLESSFRLTCQGISPLEASVPPTILLGLENPGRLPHSCGPAAVAGLLAAGAGKVVGVALVVVLTSSALTMLLLVLKCIGGTVRTMEVGKAEIASKIQSLSLVTRV